MKRLIKAILYSILVVLFFNIHLSVNAESAGGQVITPSGITFFQEKEVPTPKPKEPPKNITESVKKLLPQTGEKTQADSILAIGASLLIIVSCITLKRRRGKYEA